MRTSSRKERAWLCDRRLGDVWRLWLLEDNAKRRVRLWKSLARLERMRARLLGYLFVIFLSLYVIPMTYAQIAGWTVEADDVNTDPIGWLQQLESGGVASWVVNDANGSGETPFAVLADAQAAWLGVLVGNLGSVSYIKVADTGGNVPEYSTLDVPVANYADVLSGYDPLLSSTFGSALTTFGVDGVAWGFPVGASSMTNAAEIFEGVVDVSGKTSAGFGIAACICVAAVCLGLLAWVFRRVRAS